MMTEELHSFQCPNCGAKLHPKPDATQVTCEFCDAVSPLPHAKAKPPKPSVQPAPPVSAPKPVPGQLGWLARVSNMLPWLLPVVIGVPLAADFIWKNVRSGGVTGTTVQITSTPIIGDVDGDGHEDLLAQWLERGKCVTGLIDGVSHKMTWSVAVQGDCKQPVLAGKIAVIPSGNGLSLDLYQLPGGASVGRVDLDDKVTAIVGHGDQVWVDMAGIPAEVLVDVPSKKITAHWITTTQRPAQRPTWVEAPAHFVPPAVCRPSPCLDADSQRPIPQVPDLVPLQVLIPDGSATGAIVGRKQRGTRLVTVAGYSIADQQVLWTRDIGTPDTTPPSPQLWTGVTSDTVFVQYGLKQMLQTRIAALSLATGEQMWEVTPAARASGLRQLVVGQYVYVPLDPGIEIRDPRTGKLVATVP